jgi:hypothetical protein
MALVDEALEARGSKAVCARDDVRAASPTSLHRSCARRAGSTNRAAQSWCSNRRSARPGPARTRPRRCRHVRHGCAHIVQSRGSGRRPAHYERAAGFIAASAWSSQDWGRRPERECARPVELHLSIHANRRRECRVLGRHLPPPVKLAMMAAAGALGIALAAGCMHTPSTTTSTSDSGSAVPPSPAALPTSSATLRQRVSAYARCIGVRRDPAPRYDAQQPDAFASAGPGSADLFMYLNPRGRPIAVDVLSDDARIRISCGRRGISVDVPARDMRRKTGLRDVRRPPRAYGYSIAFAVCSSARLGSHVTEYGLALAVLRSPHGRSDSPTTEAKPPVREKRSPRSRFRPDPTRSSRRSRRERATGRTRRTSRLVRIRVNGACHGTPRGGSRNAAKTARIAAMKPNSPRSVRAIRSVNVAFG